MVIIIMLLLGWFCTAYYSGPIANGIGWGCKIGLVLILLYYVWGWRKNLIASKPKRQKRREEKRVRCEDSDPKPSFEDFTRHGYIDPPAEYNKALGAWEKRMKRRIVYELPVEVAVNMEEALTWYWKEVSTRNPARFRDSVGYKGVMECECHCEICGKLLSGGRKSSLAICNDCHNLYIYDTFRKKVPADLSADSVYRIWTRQMIAATDYRDCVISKDIMEHELQLVVALERKRLELEMKESEAQDESERKRRRQEQYQQNNVNSASRLL